MRCVPPGAGLGGNVVPWARQIVGASITVVVVIIATALVVVWYKRRSRFRYTYLNDTTDF